MSEILIPNVDLPKKEEDATYLRIDSYGHVFQYDHRTIEMRTIAKIVELPPHGRLGDLDLVEEWMRKKHKDNDCPFDIDAFLFALRKMPTVLEASKEKE